MEPEDIGQDDWQQPLVRYLSDPSKETPRSVKQQALNYALIDGILYRRGKDGLLLRCVIDQEAEKIVFQVHDGV